MPKIPKSTPVHNPNPTPEIHPNILLQLLSWCSKDTCYEVSSLKCIFLASLSYTSCTVLTSTISHPPAIVDIKCKSSWSSVCTFSQCSLPSHLLGSKSFNSYMKILCQQIQYQEPSNRFSLNMIWWNCYKICQHAQILVKINKSNGQFTKKNINTLLY
jgi:hypothetical protein